jgi:DNA-directed RNA polymerase subunit M/transcription elongation factor TFIIS
MEMESVIAGLHVGGAFVPTKMEIPVCQKCGHVDTKAPEVQEAHRIAEERVREARGARRDQAAEAPAGEELPKAPGESTAAASCAKCGGPLVRYEVPVILTMDHSFRCHCEEPGFYVDVRTDLPLLGCPSCKEFVTDGSVTQDAIKQAEKRYLEKHMAPDAEEDYFDEHGCSPPPGWVPPEPVSPLASWSLAMNPDDVF